MTNITLKYMVFYFIEAFSGILQHHMGRSDTVVQTRLLAHLKFINYGF